MFFQEVPLPNVLDFLEPGAIALLVTILMGAVVIVATAFVKEWVVPGGVHKRTSERADKILEASEKILNSQETLAKAVEELTKEVLRSRGGKNGAN